MERQIIIEALERTLQNFKEANEYRSPLTKLLQNRNPEESFKATKELTEILEKQVEFSRPMNLHFNHGSGSRVFQPHMAALFLYRQTERVGANKAVDSLIEIFSTTEADLLCVMAVRGITCDKEIQLYKDVKLVPLSSLPPSHHKEYFQNQYPGTDKSIHFLKFSPLSTVPTKSDRAFLVTTIKVKPLLFDFTQKEDNPVISETVKAHHTALALLEEIRLCLTAIGNCSPLQEFNWNQYIEQTLEDAANAASGGSFTSIEIIPHRLPKSEPISKDMAPRILNNYFKLSDDFRRKLKIALKRLNQAMRRSLVGDAAVELSVALETLLLGTEKGDNRFKVSLRSGIAFSSDLNERIKCRNVIKKMYDLRSKLIHEGIDGNLTPKSDRIIKDSIKCTCSIIVNLIENGEPNNWDELELSGKPFGS